MKKKILLLMAVATFGFIAATKAQVPNYVPTNGLVGWWPFNGNANDESGNGNNGTVNGATLTTDRNGLLNSSYQFSGNQKITVPHSNSLAFLGPAKMSVSYWFKADAYSSSQGQLSKCDPFGTIQNGWSIVMVDANLLDYQANYPNSFNFTTNHGIPSNWNHIVVTLDSGTYKAYKNGVLLASQYISNMSNASISNNYPLYFGVERDLALYFHGKIDDIGIWNRALNQQEISDLFNAVNCANNTNISPQNNSLAIGSIATFYATTSDPNPNYVWQSDFGQGFQTLNNFGNYSGANTNTLYIGNLQLHNHMQPIRVISTSGNCIDTSNVATISITDTCINTINDTNYISVTDTLIINTAVTGINPPNNLNTIKIFPNPASTHITIDYGNFAMMNGYQIKITNSLGQQIFQTPINQQSNYVSLASWGGNGLYFVYIIDPQGNTLDIRKIVLQ